MDPALVSLIPTGSIASVLLVVIVYLLKQNSADRTQYRGDVARIEKRAAADVKALTEQHTEQMDDVRAELMKMREASEEVLGRLEKERALRWKAEQDRADIALELAGFKTRGATT